MDELREQEYTIEDTWETVVPTVLVALQESGVAVTGGGLPCSEDCADALEDNPLKLNTAKIGDETTPIP